MLDLHVLVSPTTPKDWVQHCLTSIEAARQQCFFPVAVHVLHAIPGHMGKARAAAYAKGSHPYVTHVDDDDWILQNALAMLRPAINNKVEAIFTGEHHFQNNRLTTPSFRRHHLSVYNRDVLIDHSRWVAAGDVAQIASLQVRGVDVRRPGYVWRLYRRARLVHTVPDELRRARTYKGDA